MKKLFALLAVAIGVVACQKDQADMGVNLGGEQEATINVVLSEETRADSALSGLDNGVLADHDLRFILEIYNGTECVRDVKTVADGITSASFNVRLVPGHNYDFVVWADFVKNNADTYFNTSNGLDQIEMTNLDAMTEARDAYYGVVKNATVSAVRNITLKRPFAKIRVIADDVDAAKAVLHKDLSAATVTYSDVTIYNTFDARNKVVSGDAAKVKNITYPSVYDKSNLYVDYLLVPQDEQSIVKFSLNVADFVNKDFLTDIAVEANKLTTIKGDILTNGSDIKVEIEDGMAAETIYLEGNVTLTEDLVVNKSIIVRQGATAVLNLNNHNIKVNNNSDKLEEGDGIIVYGNLTIEGEGTVEANTRAVWARKETGAKVTINGGHFIGSKYGSEVIYASGNGQIVINGGTFEAVTEDKVSFAAPQYAVLNLHGNGKDGCDIVVKGGSFKNFDPANNVSENPVQSFLADGYVSVANGEWFDVIYDPYYGYAKVSTADAFKTELETGTSDIFLNSGNYEGTFKVTRNVKIVGADNAKIIGRVHINSANATFENVMFDRNETNSNEPNNTSSNALQYKAVVMIYGDQTNTIKFDGCKFFNNNGTHKSAITNVACDLIVDNCYFEGRSSSIYSQANLSVTNSTFNYTGSNNVILSINGCGDNGGKVIFKNNTITNKIFVLSQFLSTVGFGNGTYHFDIQGNSADKFDYYWANIGRVTNKTFATGSIDFSAPSL
ncbi:MAG: hypothetical protein IIU78_04700 [Alistipes sp.]|nr:hypothetical protein [Alistipes sp.]